MKVTIEVKDGKEAEAIKRGLDDKQMRALVILCGVLLPLSEGSRRRIMNFVIDRLKEEQNDEQAKSS